MGTKIDKITAYLLKHSCVRECPVLNKIECNNNSSQVCTFFFGIIQKPFIKCGNFNQYQRVKNVRLLL